jgi:DMSO/TMAO reductase YedYZ molybdopterin-dependent catalytic subunit
MSARRPPLVGRFTGEELALAGRNRGMPLEALCHDVTPAGLHYLLIHFDIPLTQESAWRLRISGRVRQAFELGMDELKALPAETKRVTLECAGNGRARLSPRYPSVPWLEEGVSTAEWTGVPLATLLARAQLHDEAKDIVFRGVDRGFDRGVEHEFARSLTAAQALREDVLVAYAMNGAPLPPQHGAPLRLVVPRWYGMASVKWLHAIEVIDRPFDGLQQASSYHFRSAAGAKGEPCTLMRVNSLMAPPGMPDFYSHKRSVAAGVIEITGRAWSGAGAIERVELGEDGVGMRARASTSFPAVPPTPPGSASRSSRPGICRGLVTMGCSESGSPSGNSATCQRTYALRVVRCRSSSDRLRKLRRTYEEVNCCTYRIGVRYGRLRTGPKGRAEGPDRHHDPARHAAEHQRQG